jgi:hypothetical protein
MNGFAALGCTGKVRCKADNPRIEWAHLSCIVRNIISEHRHDAYGGTLPDAYDHLNRYLWDGTLPSYLITLQRKAKARGYFCGDGFVARASNGTTDEIALNPDAFQGRSDRDFLSTLAHEMAHLWQHDSSAPSRTGYHNNEWADEMARIGLVASDTGRPGGKRVGQRMTHYIAEDGSFDRAASAFLAERTALEWAKAQVVGQGKAAVASARSKTRFTCPFCRQNTWAKPGAMLACANVAAHDGQQPAIMMPMDGADAASGT